MAIPAQTTQPPQNAAQAPMPQNAAPKPASPVPPAQGALLQQLQQLLTGFAPQAYNAQNTLNNQMAQYGIEGGPALALTQGLQGQLTSSLAPEIGSLIGGNAQDRLMAYLNAYGQNQGTSGQLATGLANNFAVPQSPVDPLIGLLGQLGSAWIGG